MKLYRASAYVTVYYLADDPSPRKAEQYLEEEVKNGLEPVVAEVRPGEIPQLPTTSLVYGADTDTTLGECLDAIPGHREAVAEFREMFQKRGGKA